MDAGKGDNSSRNLARDLDSLRQGGVPSQVDWAVLEAALEQEHGNSSEEEEENIVIKISRCAIFEQIKEALGLPVLQFESAKEEMPDVGVRGYIEIGLPSSEEPSCYEAVKLVGNTCASHEEAMEDVAEKVIMFLQGNGLVIVHDPSYKALESVEKRLQEAEEKKAHYIARLEKSFKYELKMAAHLEELRELVLRFRNDSIGSASVPPFKQSHIEEMTGPCLLCSMSGNLPAPYDAEEIVPVDARDVLQTRFSAALNKCRVRKFGLL